MESCVEELKASGFCSYAVYVRRQLSSDAFEFDLRPYDESLCRSGLVKLSFTTHQWPEGTKAGLAILLDICKLPEDLLRRLSFTPLAFPSAGPFIKADRGLNISFPWNLMLKPGHTIHAGDGGRDVLFSFKENSGRRLDVSSLALGGALSCPTDPKPPLTWRPDSTVGCDHPWRGC